MRTTRWASEARKAARAAGIDTYHGMRCRYCRSTLRGTKHGNCLACAARQPRQVGIAAQIAGQIRYHAREIARLTKLLKVTT